MSNKGQLEEAIADSTASDYDKGNILYLAEHYADVKIKEALKALPEEQESEANPEHTDMLNRYNSAFTDGYNQAIAMVRGALNPETRR